MKSINRITEMKALNQRNLTQLSIRNEVKRTVTFGGSRNEAEGALSPDDKK